METVRFGDIVFSLAGHDRGQVFLVLKTDSGMAWLVNGKTRKLSNPKVKNLKHIKKGKFESPELVNVLCVGKATDSVIRKELARFQSEAGITEEV